MSVSKKEFEVLKKEICSKFSNVTIDVDESSQHAYASINGAGNCREPKIKVSRKLINLPFIDKRGLSLILIHEIGHSFTKIYFDRNCMHTAINFKFNTIEGEADFFAVINLLFIWSKPYYRKNIDAAINQFEQYLMSEKVDRVRRTRRSNIFMAARNFVISFY